MRECSFKCVHTHTHTHTHQLQYLSERWLCNSKIDCLLSGISVASDYIFRPSPLLFMSFFFLPLSLLRPWNIPRRLLFPFSFCIHFSNGNLDTSMCVLILCKQPLVLPHDLRLWVQHRGQFVISTVCNHSSGSGCALCPPFYYSSSPNFLSNLRPEV